MSAPLSMASFIVFDLLLQPSQGMSGTAQVRHKPNHRHHLPFCRERGGPAPFFHPARWLRHNSISERGHRCEQVWVLISPADLTFEQSSLSSSPRLSGRL